MSEFTVGIVSNSNRNTRRGFWTTELLLVSLQHLKSEELQKTLTHSEKECISTGKFRKERYSLRIP